MVVSIGHWQNVGEIKAKRKCIASSRTQNILDFTEFINWKIYDWIFTMSYKENAAEK